MNLSVLRSSYLVNKKKQYKYIHQDHYHTTSTTRTTRSQNRYHTTSRHNSDTYQHHRHYSIHVNQKRFYYRNIVNSAKSEELYQILGVEKNASKAEIKKAYYKLAKQYHPDKNSGQHAMDMFRRISDAYNVLSDPKTRERYDNHGIVDDGDMDPEAQFQKFILQFGLENLVDNENRGKENMNKGENVHVNGVLTMKQMLKGCIMSFQGEKRVKCPSCVGTGAKDGNLIKCHYCNDGIEERLVSGILKYPQVCGKCKGVSYFIEKPCGSCKGRGTILTNKLWEIEIPETIENEQIVIIEGEGHEGERGGPPGDLVITVTTAEDPVFRFSKTDDILVTAQLSITQAIEGGTFLIPTPDGEFAEITVPGGIQPDQQYTVKGKGNLSEIGQGNLIVEFEVNVPKPESLSKSALSSITKMTSFEKLD